MHYVYILRSIISPERTYVGYTSDLKARFKAHNEGQSPHTNKYKPWTLEWYCAFPDKWKAMAVESYLKSHSGNAFMNKRLILQLKSTSEPPPLNST